VGVAFCGFLLKAPHGHPFWFSGNQGHSILPSYWPPAVISDIPQSTALPSTAFPLSYRTFSPRLCRRRPFRRHTGLSTVPGFAVPDPSAVIPDLQSTAFLPSYRTYSPRPFRCHTGLHYSLRLCRPRPFHRHTGLFTVHGLSTVIPDFPKSTALPSTAFLGILFLPLVLTK
jgi:hypothetical protein